MNTLAPSPLHLLRRWLTLLLAVLLAMGPFLHGHFGASHETGFHIDGMHAVHNGPADAALAPASLHTSDEESLALGVATSLPHSEDEGLPLLALVLLLAALPLLPALRQLLPRAPHRHRPRGSLYRAGLPPPCLAPPER